MVGDFANNFASYVLLSEVSTTNNWEINEQIFELQMDTFVSKDDRYM